MFLEKQPGSLIEPLTGRRWDPETIRNQVRRRVQFYHAQGMAASENVFLHYGNRLEFFADLLAIWSLGACAIPIDQRLTQFEVQTLAAAAAPRFSLWCGSPDTSIAGALASLGAKVLDVSEPASSTPRGSVPPPVRAPLLEENALVLFTSGTTGRPKGVVHTHRSLRARWMGLRQALGSAKFRRTLCLLPTHFGHGLICNSLYPWLSGADLFIVPPFKADLVMRLGAILDEHAITFMSSVPSVWRLALKASRPPRRRSLQRVFCGSAPLSAHMWGQIQEWSGTGEVFNSYGITETGSWVAGTTVEDFTPEDGLIGVGWGAGGKILKTGTTDAGIAEAEECAPGESGYVWLNTPALMKGYLGRDDLTSQVVSQGWFLTGDIGLVDERGLLYLRGREREEINKGGMKIYPGDIDSVVEQFETALDVSSFACEDHLYGQNIGMAVVLKSHDDETIRSLHEWMRRHLGEHQMPVRWYVVDSIPRTSRGKINRAKVAETCAGLTPIDMHRVLGKR
jgi:acyl-CoA synthetase (AMP-forming)/AMP-acid ligase II